mgnify:CR=1 FL=1
MISFDATADQTVFTLPFSYTPGAKQLFVYSAGLIQAPVSEYTETDTTTITFLTGRVAGEKVIVSRIALQDLDTTNMTLVVNNDYTTMYITNEFVNQYTTEYNDYTLGGEHLSYSVDATEGQKVFILPFQYVLFRNELEVHSGGLLMHVGSDYTETDSTRITFFEGRLAGEKIVVTKIGLSNPLDFTSGVLWNPVTVTTDYVASSYDRIFANSTDGTFSITLPASPQINHEIEIICVADSFETNPVTLLPNGKKIMGNTSFTLDFNASIQLVYSGETRGWVLK